MVGYSRRLAVCSAVLFAGALPRIEGHSTAHLQSREPCVARARVGSKVILPTEWGVEQGEIGSEVRRRLSTPPVDSATYSMVPLSIDDLWRRDSSAVEWSLAEVLGDRWSAPESEAILAGLTYAAYSGRAEPVLIGGAMRGPPNRQLLAMRAVSQPLSTAAEAQVMHVICDAAWLLRAMRRDSTYWTPSLPEWGYQLEDLLYEGYRLLSAGRRDDMRAFLSGILLAPKRLDLIDDSYSPR